MKRVVVPEILDGLEADDPVAQRSRRDIMRINRLMRGEAWIVRHVQQMNGVKRVVELGAGDGFLSSKLAKLRPDLELVAVDLQPRPAAVAADVQWLQADVLEGDLPIDDTTVVVANLFIHHFKAEQLERLIQRISAAKAVLFAEPHRQRVALTMGLTLFPFVNAVTRHDMMVSVRAGFVRGELAELLGESFDCSETIGLMGSMRCKGEKS